MKVAILIFTVLLTMSVFSQNKTEVEVIQIANDDKPECVIWPINIRPIAVVYSVDVCFRNQIKRPSEYYIQNIWMNKEASYRLSKDNPVLQTLTTGTVYTFDHIRYTVR